MIAKTLLLTCDLLDATERIRKQLEAELFATEFLPRLRQIHQTLSLGPNPELTIPLLDILEWGFHSPVQPMLETIIYAQGFDWRFVTGRRRRFTALSPGQNIPPMIAILWERAREKSMVCMADFLEKPDCMPPHTTK